MPVPPTPPWPLAQSRPTCPRALAPARWLLSHARRAGVPVYPPPRVPSYPSYASPRRSRLESRSPGWIAGCGSPVWLPSDRALCPPKGATVRANRGPSPRTPPRVAIAAFVDRRPPTEAARVAYSARQSRCARSTSVHRTPRASRGCAVGRLLQRAPGRVRQRPTLPRKRRLGMVFELPCQDATASGLKFITPPRHLGGVPQLLGRPGRREKRRDSGSRPPETAGDRHLPLPG